MTEVAGNFPVDIGGMQQGSRAMEERDERQSQRSMPSGRAAKLSGEALLHEFERRHVFLAGVGNGPIFGDEAEVTGMGGEEIERAAANLRG